LSALRHDYQLPQIKADKLGKNSKVALVHDSAYLEKQLEKIHKDYTKYRERTIEAGIDALDHEQKQQLMNAFLEYAEDTIQVILKLQRKKYNRDNILESPQVKAILRKFALRELTHLSFMSLEEFVLTLDDKQKISWQQMKSLDPGHVLLSCKDFEVR
jgi:hypothetical protein